MAGIKISKLKPFEEIFDDANVEDYIDNMIVPVSLGNKTIRVKLSDIIHYVVLLDTDQRAIDDAQYQMILNNTELINQLSEQIVQKINEMKAEQEEIHQQMKEEQEAIHEEMKEEQYEVDTAQDERINDISDSANLWEIYNSESEG